MSMASAWPGRKLLMCPTRMRSGIVAIYRASKKKNDINWFTEWVARPPAAVVVYALQRSRITPNQVTFASAFVAVAACAMFVVNPGCWLWVVAAALVFDLPLQCSVEHSARR